MIRFILFFILFSTSILIDAQDLKEQINGYWIREKAEFVNATYILDLNDPLNRIYNSYEFTNNSKLRISNTPFDVGTEVDYKLFNNKIIYNTQRLIITHVSDSLLILEEDFESNGFQAQPLRYYFYKRDYLVSKMKLEGQITIINDTLVISPAVSNGFGTYSSYKINYPNSSIYYKPTPRFQDDDFTLERFFQNKIGLLPNKKRENKASFSFVINENNELINFKILSGSNKKLNKAISRVINQSKRKWLAPIVNGREVPVEMIFNLKLVEPTKFR